MAKFGTDAWLEIQGMKKRMDQLMDDVRERFDMHQRGSEKVALWQPVTDAYETVSAYVVQMELPGLEREQINIEVQNGELWVYGERRLVKDAQGSDYHMLERSYGPFARKFSLPFGADSVDIQATFQNGLLTVNIPKRQHQSTVKKIDVTEE
jgi:HSP20 family protein